MALTEVRPAYMARVKVPGIGEPLWLIAQRDERVNRWVGYCPTAWLSNRQRQKAGVETNEYMMLPVDPDNKGTRIFYDKPVQCRRVHMIKKIKLDEIDYGYRWEFDAPWLP